MGMFGELVETSQANAWEPVCEALKEKNDGSFEEFVSAVGNKRISVPSIVNAIYKSTGIKVSDSTVRRWRSSMVNQNG